MTAITTVVKDQFATATWGNSVRDGINNAVQGGAAIIHLATTPTGSTNELRWSTVHQCMMRWSGTQWVFADGFPSYFAPVCTDLIGAVSTSDFIVSAVSLGTTSVVASVALHQGVMSFTTGASTNSGTVCQTATGGLIPVAGLRFMGVFNVNMVPGDHTFRIGMHDTSTSADATDGCYLEVVGTTATFKTSQGGSRTGNGTTATLVSSTWYTTHIIIVTATTARCIVLKDDGTVVLDVTNVANVPAGAQYFGAGMIGTKAANSGGVLLGYMDYFGVGYSPV
jgi:hypothetical protein